MKLDVNVLRYLTKDDFRVLTAVEMGQKNVSMRLQAACTHGCSHVFGLMGSLFTESHVYCYFAAPTRAIAPY